MKNISTIGILLKQGKLNEARALLDAAISQPLTDIERGRAIVTLVMAYLQSKNTLDKQFLDDMKKTIEALKKANATGQGVADKLRMETIRDSLSL